MSSVLSNATQHVAVAAAAQGQPRPTLTIATLLVGDLLSVSASVGVCYALSVALGHEPVMGPWHVLGLLVVVPLCLSLADLYPAAGVSPVDELRSIVLILTTLAAAAVLVTTSALGPSFTAILQISVLYFALLVSVIETRILLRELLSHRAWWGVPVVVLGAGSAATLIIDSLKRKANLNLKVTACLDDNPSKWGSDIAGLRVGGPLEEEARRLRRSGVNYAIVAMPGLPPTSLSTLVDKLGRLFAKVVVTPNAFGMTSAGVGTRDSGAVVGLYVRGHLSLRRNLLIKRALDIVILVPLAVVAVPVLTFAAVATVVVSPGTPFYAQEREGYGGRRIRMWKLRTMRPNAEQLLREHLLKNPEAQAEWQTRFKLRDDPRIIPIVGGLFRRLSLDELPQLWNIAKGELSFVGPRPFPDYHLASFDESFRRLRASVPPGLTGYWQVTSRATADIAGQVELDSYYIANWSLWLDLYVIARTPWAVIFGRGAY